MTYDRDAVYGLISSIFSGTFKSNPPKKISFGMDRKYEKIPGLIMVFVFECRSSTREIYAMTYRQMVGVGGAMGWTKTPSWKDKNSYSTAHPSPKLMALLLSYRMDRAQKRLALMT